MDNKAPSTGYSKRPIWQWVLLYIIVGGIIYAGIYYVALARRGGYDSTNKTYQNSNGIYNYNYNYNVNQNSGAPLPGNTNGTSAPGLTPVY